MQESLSQRIAREILGERQGRSVSQILSDKSGMSVDGVHALMFLGALFYLSSK